MKAQESLQAKWCIHFPLHFHGPHWQTTVQMKHVFCMLDQFKIWHLLYVSLPTLFWFTSWKVEIICTWYLNFHTHRYFDELNLNVFLYQSIHLRARDTSGLWRQIFSILWSMNNKFRMKLLQCHVEIRLFPKQTITQTWDFCQPLVWLVIQIIKNLTSL